MKSEIKTKRIYWQADDCSKHEIPECAAVYVETDEGGIKIWIDKNGKINLATTKPVVLRRKR